VVVPVPLPNCAFAGKDVKATAIANAIEVIVNFLIIFHFLLGGFWIFASSQAALIVKVTVAE
jgi:hypothetical protein